MTSEDLKQDLPEYTDLYEFKNYGIDLKKQKEKFEDPRNYRFGAISGLEVLKPDGDWSRSMPVFQIQKTLKCDLMNCLNQAPTKVYEILIERFSKEKIDISQRYPSKLSNTTPAGNDMFSVGEAWKKHAFVEEKDWEYKEDMSWNEYYAPIPSKVLDIGKKVLKQFDFNYQIVGTSDKALKEALKYGPVVVIGHAWIKCSDGMYRDYRNTPNHAFLLVKINDDGSKLIFDSYPEDYQVDGDYPKEEFLKTLAPDFNIAYAMLYSIKLKTNDRKAWYIKLMSYLKGVVRFHKDLGGDNSLYQLKETKAGGKMRKKVIDTDPKSVLELMLELFNKNVGEVKNVGYGELSAYKEVDKF